MSKADVLRLTDYLEHITEAIQRIERYTDDMDEVAFLLDERTQDAVIRNSGWFQSSGLGTLILQDPAWSFFGKLELQKPRSQAGAWERAKPRISTLYTRPTKQETSSFRQGLPESRSHGGQLVAEQVFDSVDFQPTVSPPCGLDSGNPCRNDGLT